MLAHVLFKKPFDLVAALTELKIVRPKRTVILALKAIEILVATTPKLVRVGEGEHPNGVSQKFGFIVRADFPVCVNKDGVWWLVGPVGFKEKLKAAVIDDTLSSDDANNCSKRRRELVGIADAFQLRKRVIYRAIVLGNAFRHGLVDLVVRA